MADEEDVYCLNVCCGKWENVDKDVDRVECVSWPRSANFKVLASIHAGVEARGVEVQLFDDKRSNSTSLWSVDWTLDFHC